jgi:hypothetical protein
MTICLTLFFAAALCQIMKIANNKKSYWIFTIPLLVPIIYLAAFSYAEYKDGYNAHQNSRSSMHQLISYFNHQKSGSTFLSLTAQEVPTLPMVLYTSLHNITPWADCWPLQAITKSHHEKMLLPQWEKKRILEYTTILPNKIATILQTDKPDFILVNTKKNQSYFNYHSFNLIDFYKQNELFRQNWHHYRLMKTISNYEIYQRITP